MTAQLDSYLRASDDNVQETGSVVLPVLFTVGTVDAGKTGVFPLYFENPNPVPITLSLDTTNLDGFSIRLGRDRLVPSDEGKSLTEAIARTWAKTQDRLGQISSKRNLDRTRGQRLESLFHFLKTSDVPRAFLDQFQYRDAVYIDRPTVDAHPRVGQRKTGVSYATFHKHDYYSADTASDSCCWLQSKRAGTRKNRRFVPGILSVDTGKFSELCRCPMLQGRKIILPPAGVARFDVTVTAPSEDTLERDVSSFVANGMVISTEIGEQISVMVSFEVSRGKLTISPFSKESRL